METIKVKRLSQTAQIPTRATEYAAGLDLYSDTNTNIIPRGRALIETHIAMEIPEGYFGWVVGRSSVSAKGLNVASGIIDSDYRGGMKVMLYNQTGDSLMVERGQKIAQLVIMPYLKCGCVEAKELSKTKRGENGFGSSGV